MSIQQVLQQPIQNQATRVPVPASVVDPAPPVIEPVYEELVQVVTLKGDNLPVAGHPASAIKEPTIFVSRAGALVR